MKQMTQKKKFLATALAQAFLFALFAFAQQFLPDRPPFTVIVSAGVVLVFAATILLSRLRAERFDELAEENMRIALARSWEDFGDIILIFFLFACAAPKMPLLARLRPSVAFALLLSIRHILIAVRFYRQERKSAAYVEEEDFAS